MHHRDRIIGISAFICLLAHEARTTNSCQQMKMKISNLGLYIMQRPQGAAHEGGHEQPGNRSDCAQSHQLAPLQIAEEVRNMFNDPKRFKSLPTALRSRTHSAHSQQCTHKHTHICMHVCTHIPGQFSFCTVLHAPIAYMRICVKYVSLHVSLCSLCLNPKP